MPYGVLLSGGLDSSLVASCVVKMCKAKGLPPPVTFSIGLVGSPDLFNAQKVYPPPPTSCTLHHYSQA